MSSEHTHPNQKLLYTARTHTIGGRLHGEARSSDGQLNLKFSIPGSGLPGTNPEQLLAAGWSACFEGALGRVARARRVKLPAEPVIDAEVDLNDADAGYFLRARLNVSLPGLDPSVGEPILIEASKACPYSKALSGNIDITYTLV